jgi:fatty acid synthase
VGLVHAKIGWVRGTGLMGGNDPLVDAVEAAGVRTFSTAEMAAELLERCEPAARARALEHPLEIDLTGGLAAAQLDLAQLAKDQRAAAAAAPAEPKEEATQTIPALPSPPSAPSATEIDWPQLGLNPADLVVIVGAGEVGPWGSSRTRFEMEVRGELSTAALVELAWSTGLITWESAPKAGWFDAATGEPVDESDMGARYAEQIEARCGIRAYADDGALVEGTAPLLASVFLDKDLSFTVPGEAEARAFASADPAGTSVSRDGDEWRITRKAGTEIRVPRRAKLTRTVGAQIPTGFDVTKWGVPAEMADAVDRVALWNLVATVDAFLASGFTPAELLRWVHPSLVADTQGTGMGGMSAMRSLYIDTLLGAAKQNDILQEALPNVIAAHVMQSYVGGYGAMVHPVGACATAAVSVEEAVDKIALGKAEFAVAGGYDDLGIEGITGFGDMAATANTEEMRAKGIADARFSRANDRRRGGFVEAAGGGTVLLARGDLALAMGLPVLGVVAYAGSFADGAHTSIPAPGLGALGAGRGGASSRLAKSLRALGVEPDEVAVLSKHDTATAANDPNEAELHERLAAALGRSDGAPLFVVSQKSLTGHAKGGAAAFQLIGLTQILASGTVPPNRSLDCVDPQMEKHQHLVWARKPLQFKDSLPLKAGVLTSLGFGHVSGLIAVVHPSAFLATVPEGERAAYQAKAKSRQAWGARRLASAMCGGPALYERPEARRLGKDADHSLEAAVLLSDTARLGEDGRYRV